MLRNYFNIAFRQLIKQRFYSFINIAGLAISISCCLLIALFIKNELSYDRHHPKADRIYRIALDINLNNSQAIGLALPAPMTKTLLEEIPEIEKAARLNRFFANAGTNLIRPAKASESSFEEKFVYADHSFFEIFHLPTLYQSQDSLLSRPNTVVISKRIADKFFPGQNPVGERLIMNEDAQQFYEITGVIENIPANSHFDYDFFMSMKTLRGSENNNWIANNYHGYALLKPGTDLTTLQEKLLRFGNKHMGPQFKERLDVDFETMREQGYKYDIILQPLKEIHLHSEGMFPQLKPTGDIRYVRLFGAIALFILIIAVINFVNLSTARSANRAKEVGVRKALGSQRSQLVFQFLTESVLLSFLAFMLGLFTAELLVPYFNNLADKNIEMPWREWWFGPSFFVCSLFTGILAGLYPSFYLSAFQPVEVLKSKLSQGKHGGFLRGGLVVFQFAISIGLIVGTLVVYKQIEFIQNKKLGFEKNQILLIQDCYMLGEQIDAFKAELKKLPEVKNATVTSFLPLDGGFRNSNTFNYDGNSETKQVFIEQWPVDYDYISTMGMKLLRGRNFSTQMPTDSQAVILNQTAVRRLGITEPIGKQIKAQFGEDQPLTIIGVIEDFHFKSLKDEVDGLCLQLGRSTATVSVKAQFSDIESLIAKSEKVWKAFAPNQSFRYEFLDERFASMYKTESKAGALFRIFALLAIFIACLGLFALSTFMAEQRTKEIGIRKVLGASIFQVAYLLSKNFLLLVILGLVLAIPVSWYFMNDWLSNFVYRIHIHWSLFVLAGTAAILISVITVSFQAIRAAMGNPVNALKEN